MANLPNNFFEISAPDPLDTDEATLKLDHHLSQSHNLALTYFYQKGTDTQPLSETGPPGAGTSRGWIVTSPGPSTT